MRSTASSGRRICVYGPSGSGKSTLARLIGQRLGLPVVELDAIFHSRPNWDDLSTEEFREAVISCLSTHREGWVVDGNYSPVRDLILPSADTVIWLRLPWRVVYPRLVRRTIRRVRTRELLWGVNREAGLGQLLTPKESMLWAGIQLWRPHHQKTIEALATIPHSANLIELRSPAAVRGFLANLPPRP